MQALMIERDISEFPKLIHFSNCHFYADDMQLYLSFPATELLEANTQLNSHLESIITISEKFCLSIDTSRSVFMLFGEKVARNRYIDALDIKIKDVPIIPIDGAKNLGIILDCSLNSSEHVNLVIRAFCNLKLILCEYLVFLHLTYGDIIYGPAISKRVAQRLQLVQNSCLRTKQVSPYF
ncbi:hypothetical protein JTB14_000980 [Gonioctena quinquepunctata]|nr:hypothetical protein JTB14_000980 [Gonioctena quinquepunctata]